MRKALHGCKYSRTRLAAVGSWQSSQEMCNEQEVMAATERTPRRRRRGHCRAPGIKPLEIVRDGGGKAADFALSLTGYQYDFAVRSLLDLHSHSARVQSSKEVVPQEVGDVPRQRKGRCPVGATCGTSHQWVCQGAIHPRHSLRGSSQSLRPRGTVGCFTPGKVSGISPCAWRSFLLLSTVLQKLAISWLFR